MSMKMLVKVWNEKNMKKCVFFLLLIVLFSVDIIAIPALNKIIKLKQSDGKNLSVVLCGDECTHFFMTMDSIPIFETEKGYCYGIIENDEIRITNVLAHDVWQRAFEEASFENNKNKVRSFLLHRQREKSLVSNNRRQNKYRQNRVLGDSKPFLGNRKGLVILVNFANLSMRSEQSQYIFDNLFNQSGYSENGSIGSVHDYFFDQSYGKFNLTFDVIGPVTVSQNFGYYGSNSEIYGYDRKVKEMVIEACQLIDERVNFQDYDWDGDGEVDQVFIIYAGYGEHAGAPSNTIWPHESSLGNKKIILDGVKINTYACSCELNGTSGDIICGIGTPCHEFSHCLGLPDLYDTDYSGAFGMSFWDIMNSGSYSGPNASGEVPYGYSAYERCYAGWLEMKEISSTQHIDAIPNLENKPEAYIIYNKGNKNEYYILENHQPTKWYKYVKNFTHIHGLMVTHVDYDAKAWASNAVNPTSKHQRLSIIPADNSYGETEKDLRGDLFPGSNFVQWLTNYSHITVGGKLFNENTDGSYRMNRSIGNIIENDDGSISMDIVFAEDVPAPIIKDITEINNYGFTVNWEAVPNAEYYIVEQKSYKIGSSIIPIVKKQTVENIFDTSLKLEWLTDGTTSVHVKAIVNGFESDWSENVDVSKYVDSIDNIVVSLGDKTTYFGIEGFPKGRLTKGFNIIKYGNQVRKVLFK